MVVFAFKTKPNYFVSKLVCTKPLYIEVPHFCKHDLRRGVAIGPSEHNVQQSRQIGHGAVFSLSSNIIQIFSNNWSLSLSHTAHVRCRSYAHSMPISISITLKGNLVVQDIHVCPYTTTLAKVERIALDWNTNVIRYGRYGP